MKSMTLIVPHAGIRIEVIEDSAKAGQMSEDRIYVENIYRYFFKTFNLSTATQCACHVAKLHLNSLIEKMPTACAS